MMYIYAEERVSESARYVDIRVTARWEPATRVAFSVNEEAYIDARGASRVFQSAGDERSR